MKKSELTKGFSQFGNHGAVWTNQTHISKSGDWTHRTLCGTPMLSRNWAEIEEHQEIGCKDCIVVYEYLQRVQEVETKRTEKTY
jgi:hypothetical protein